MNTTTRNMLAVPVMNRSLGKDEGKVIAVRCGVELAMRFSAKCARCQVMHVSVVVVGGLFDEAHVLV